MSEIAKSFVPNVDVKDYLDEKGVSYKDAGRWVHLRCLFPDHEDSNPSMSIDTQALAYNCYGCKRSGTWSALCADLGWEVDAKPMADVVNRALWSDVARGIKDAMRQEAPVDHIAFHIPSGYSPQHPLAIDYMEKRGFELNTLERFEIGYGRPVRDSDYEDAYYNRIIIPVRDEGGRYLWPEGRTVLDGDRRPKYYRPKGTRKELFLFNFHNLKDDFDPYVIVVEGIMDPMILYQWGFSAVCTFGADLSDRQLQLLMGRYSEIFWCHDTDKAGIASWKKHKDRLASAGSSIYKVTLPRGVDPSGMAKDLGSEEGKAEFIKYMNEAKRWH